MIVLKRGAPDTGQAREWWRRHTGAGQRCDQCALPFPEGWETRLVVVRLAPAAILIYVICETCHEYLQTGQLSSLSSIDAHAKRIIDRLRSKALPTGADLDRVVVSIPADEPRPKIERMS